MAALANEYAPPVCGIAADISPMLNSMPKYMITTMPKAMTIPPQPEVDNPRFHPEKSPEMTAAIPRPQSPHTPALRFSERFSKYPTAAFVYVTPETLEVLSTVIGLSLRKWSLASSRASLRTCSSTAERTALLVLVVYL
jgi:hypothetical protein